MSRGFHIPLQRTPEFGELVEKIAVAQDDPFIPFIDYDEAQSLIGERAIQILKGRFPGGGTESDYAFWSENLVYGALRVAGEIRDEISKLKPEDFNV
jgi:hypothetical protein